MRLSLSDAVHSTIIVEACAQMAHEALRAYGQAVGDPSRVPWEEAPSWQRSSVIQGVQGVLQGNTPRENHASWMKQKMLEGWMFGPLKDPELRTHPRLMPYDSLPLEQQMKDHLFVGAARAMASALIGTPSIDFTDQPSLPPEPA